VTEKPLCRVHGSLKPLLNNNESISDCSNDIVVCLGLNDKHSHRINLKHSTKERAEFKHYLFILDFIRKNSTKVILKMLKLKK
jgi:hypothetical protein